MNEPTTPPRPSPRPAPIVPTLEPIVYNIVQTHSDRRFTVERIYRSHGRGWEWLAVASAAGNKYHLSPGGEWVLLFTGAFAVVSFPTPEEALAQWYEWAKERYERTA